jgi:hypothetical protein
MTVRGAANVIPLAFQDQADVLVHARIPDD